MSKIDELAKVLIDSTEIKDKKKTSAYDTTARVVAVEGNIAWVSIAGGVEKTPAIMAVNAKVGDDVRVRVGGGKAYVTGNVAAPPTDDSTAKKAESAASRANRAANIADAKAEEASKAATKATQDAAIAHEAAESAVADAAIAKESAESAQADAITAKESASNASEYAARALGNLSTVQNVTETLNWITAHGTMTLTDDQALDPTHVYFVVDENGDYEVAGTHYSVVTEPSIDDISTYYELSIDESLNNYVGTHLAVTSEGLWLLPDAGGNKVLIATGQGSTYTSAGTYIIGKVNNVDTVLATFGASGAQIGRDEDTHTTIDYHSLQLVDKEGNTYLHVSDLRNEEGIATVSDRFYGDGSTRSFQLSVGNIVSLIEVKVGTTVKEEGTDYTFSVSTITFVTAPRADATIVVQYATTDYRAKAFTFGTRGTNNAIGAGSFSEGYRNVATGGFSHAEGYRTEAIGRYSHAEGNDTSASGFCSHAEGSQCFAQGTESHAEGRMSGAYGFGSHAENQSDAYGQYSHTEGYRTEAYGNNSHAGGYFTIANGENQTVIGRNNIPDTTSAFIIGNGTDASDTDRANAFMVGFNNSIRVGLNTSASTGDDHDLYIAITALGWASDVIE